MTVKALLQTLLIHVMTNETDTSAEHEQRVNGSDVDVFLSFLAKIEIIHIKEKLIFGCSSIDSP